MPEEVFTISAEIVPKDLEKFTKKLEEQFGKISLTPKAGIQPRLTKALEMERVVEPRGAEAGRGMGFAEMGMMGGLLGGKGAGGMMGMLTKIALPLMALTIIKNAVMKGLRFIMKSSPVLGKMFELIKNAIMMTIRPIGDFIGLLLRPFILLYYKYFLIPFFQHLYPKIFAMSDDFNAFVENKIVPLVSVVKDDMAIALHGVWDVLVNVIGHIISLVYNWMKDAIYPQIKYTYDEIKAIWAEASPTFDSISGALHDTSLALTNLAVKVAGAIWDKVPTLTVKLLKEVVPRVEEWWEKYVTAIGISTMAFEHVLRETFKGFGWKWLMPHDVIEWFEDFAREHPIGGIPMQMGGYVSEAGLYSLHAGETVIPKRGGLGNVFNTNIYIDKVEKDVDIDKIGDRLVRIFREKGGSYSI